MNMGYRRTLLLTFVLLHASACAADQLITFEDIVLPPGESRAVTSGYAGFYWTGFVAQNVSAPENPNRAGLVSGQNIAYQNYAATFQLDAGLQASTPFTLKSIWAASASSQLINLQVTADTASSNYSTYFQISNRVQLQLNLTNILSVRFYQSDGTIVYDDILVTPPVPDAPAPPPALFKLGDTFFPAGGGASVAAGDFNGDGFPDLAVVGMKGSQIRINTPAGVQIIPVSGATWASVGDANSDGHDDLVFWGGHYVGVVHNSDYPEQLTVKYAVVAPYFDGIGPIVAGDFDLSQRYASGPASKSTDLAAGDFDHDGRLDYAVVMNDSPPRISTFRNVSSRYGVFITLTNLVQTNHTPVAILTHDFNHDDFLDLATVNENTGAIAITLNNGAGKFGAWTYFQSGLERPSALAVADMNGDGLEDILVRNAFSAVNLLPGKSTGGFDSPISILGAAASGTNRLVRSLAVADLNNDGRPDIAVVRGLDIITLLNVAAPPLKITPVADLLRIHWQKDFARGALIETASSPDGPWQPHPFPPVTEESEAAVYDSAKPTTRFFRLRLPNEPN
jgi:hypothetical protein